MSTRSTMHFQSNWTDEPVTDAIIYRHSDGYPQVAAVDIFRFFAQVQSQTRDTRFTDASYLAAKYVVWLAGEFRGDQPLDFLSVGVCMEDPGDIEYRYLINCGQVQPDGWPNVTCQTYNGHIEPIEHLRREVLAYAAA